MNRKEMSTFRFGRGRDVQAESAAWAFQSIFSICVECSVDREVHATAGQEAGATCSFSDRQP
jgi:hypothetical protein